MKNLVVAVEAQKALLDAVLVEGVGGLELFVLLHELRIHVLKPKQKSTSPQNRLLNVSISNSKQ